MSNSITQPRGGKRASEISLAVTLGKGADRPKGARRRLATWSPSALADLLNEHTGVQAWFSLHAWHGDKRNADNWIGAAGVVLDLDTAGHADMSAEMVERLCAAAEAGVLPSNVFYATPAGARLIWLFDRVISDQREYVELVEACRLDALAALRRAGVDGLDVDDSAMDLARLFYTPRATAKGKRRNATAVVVHHEVLEVYPSDVTPRKDKHGQPALINSLPCIAAPGFGDEQLRRINEALAETLPTETGTRNSRLFVLARALKAIAPSAGLARFRQLIEHWHAAGLERGTIRTKDARVSWQDFVTAWQRVQVPLGQAGADFDALLARAVADADPEAVKVAGLIGFDRPEEVTLLALCVELQRQAGDGPFRLSSRCAAKALKLEAREKQAWREMRKLVRMGVLHCLDRGEDYSTAHAAGKRKTAAAPARYVWKGGELL